MLRIAGDETGIESMERAISAPDGIAGFLDDASRRMATADMAEEDPAAVAVAVVIGVAFCRICEAVDFLKADCAAWP